MEIHWIEQRSWWQVLAFFVVLFLVPCGCFVGIIVGTFGDGPGPLYVEINNRTAASVYLRFDLLEESSSPGQSVPAGTTKWVEAFSQDQRAAAKGFRARIYRSEFDTRPACTLDLSPQITEFGYREVEILIEGRGLRATVRRTKSGSR